MNLHRGVASIDLEWLVGLVEHKARKIHKRPGETDALRVVMFESKYPPAILP